MWASLVPGPVRAKAGSSRLPLDESWPEKLAADTGYNSRPAIDWISFGSIPDEADSCGRLVG